MSRYLKIFLVFAFVLFLVTNTSQAADISDVKATNQEIINEIGRVSGLSKETLDLLMGEAPGLFDGFNNTVTAVKVVDLLFSAKDAEAISEIYNWQLGNIVDDLMKKTFPSAMGTFLTSVKVYKASLELIRDYIFLPSLEEDIYKRYKSARGGVQDYRYANPEEAFTEATMRGKYFPLKQKMYDQLLKAKGYDVNYVGKKLEKYLWAKVDSFWQKRLEATYQQELFKKNRERLVKYIWDKKRSKLAAIMAAAEELKKNPLRMFVQLSGDLPEGWWQTQSPYENQMGRPSIGPSIWQVFHISNCQGFVFSGDRYVDSENPDRLFYSHRVSVQINHYVKGERLQEKGSGGGKTYTGNLEPSVYWGPHIEKEAKKTDVVYVAKDGMSVIRVEKERSDPLNLFTDYKYIAVKNDMYVEVTVSRSGFVGGSICAPLDIGRELVEYFGKLIVSRI